MRRSQPPKIPGRIHVGDTPPVPQQGRTRFRLFNAKIGVNTMRTGDPKFDKNDGHLHLTRVVTSGKHRSPLWVPGKPLEETAFYYIEPGIEQTISYPHSFPSHENCSR